MRRPSTRPKSTTLARPATAACTSQAICLMFISGTITVSTLSAMRSTAAVGKGHRVIGRTSPTLTPFARAAFIAALAERATEP